MPFKKHDFQVRLGWVGLLVRFLEGFALKADPLKHQYPARVPTANTDQRTGFVHPAYFSSPESVRSQKVSGHTRRAYNPTTIMTPATPAKTAMAPADKLSNTSIIQC
jgi:hypothetical protein